jgi:hypothetical protein
MKKLSVAFLFCLTSTIANAQSEFRQIPKPVLCGPIELIFKSLIDSEINELPIWTGKNEDSKSDYALFVNPKTNSFTLVQFGKEWGCILGVGYKSQKFSNFTKNL